MILELLVLAQLKRLPRNIAPPAPPPPFSTSVTLVLKTADGEIRTTAMPGTPAPGARPLATVKSGEKPQIRWAVKNLDPKKPIKDLAVHLLVLKEDAAGTAIPKGLQKGSLLDTVMGTDLRASATTSGNYNTAVYEPGFYLLELELLDRQGNRRGVATLDLEVK